MSLPTVHGEGRIVGEPELRFTPQGTAVLQMRLAANRARFNEQTRQWEKTGECWLDATLWEQAAEDAAEFYHANDLIAYHGELQTRAYERSDGGKGLAVEVKIKKMGKLAPRLNQAGNGGSSQHSQNRPESPRNDGGFGSAADEPPF